MAQKSFSFLFVAASVIISGELMANLPKHPDSFITIRNEIVGFTIFCLVLILFPLLFFSSKLIKLKRDGQVHLSNLGVELSSKFEEEWVNDLPIETRISAKQVDPSMLYDYSGLYDSLEKLRPAPVTLRDLIGIVIPLLVPFIPILFIQFSVLELMQKILKLLV